MFQFGKGIYFADLVSKSAQYCYTCKKNPVGLMLLSEVALGEIHELTKAKVSPYYSFSGYATNHLVLILKTI